MAEGDKPAPKSAGLSTAVGEVAGPSSSGGAGAVSMDHVLFAGTGGGDVPFGDAGDDAQLVSYGDGGIDNDPITLLGTSDENFEFLSLDSDRIEEFQAGDRIDLGAIYGSGGLPATGYVGDFTPAGQFKLSIVDVGMPFEGNVGGNGDADVTIMFVNPIISGSDLE